MLELWFWLHCLYAGTTDPSGRALNLLRRNLFLDALKKPTKYSLMIVWPKGTQWMWILPVLSKKWIIMFFPMDFLCLSFLGVGEIEMLSLIPLSVNLWIIIVRDSIISLLLPTCLSFCFSLSSLRRNPNFRSSWIILIYSKLYAYCLYGRMAPFIQIIVKFLNQLWCFDVPLTSTSFIVSQLLFTVLVPLVPAKKKRQMLGSYKVN